MAALRSNAKCRRGGKWNCGRRTASPDRSDGSGLQTSLQPIGERQAFPVLVYGYFKTLTLFSGPKLCSINWAYSPCAGNTTTLAK